jgi:ABC-2 type transport system permease protein
MNKVVVIAAREYKAAVHTKSFLISVLLMPVLMGGSAGIQYLMKKQGSTQDRRFAVVDLTPGAKIFPLLEKAAQKRNETGIFDPETHQQNKPRFLLEKAEPVNHTPEAVAELRLALSQRTRNDVIWGFLEIGPDTLEILDPSKPAPPSKDRAYLRYQTNHPTFEEFPSWSQSQTIIALSSLSPRNTRGFLGILQKALGGRTGKGNDGLAMEDVERNMSRQNLLVLRRTGLSERDRNGAIIDPPVINQIARFLVPGLLPALMLMIIMLSSTPSMHGVVEEKMQRIAEVLLGSVRPFDLMLGKLLGLMAVSMTVAAVYLGGAYWAADRYGFADFLPVPMLVWYIVFQTLAVLMYGALFLAIGAASTDIKETQTLVMPVVLVACIPMFILGTALEDPNHPLVVGLSFFPFVTPMLMTARLAISPGPPWWQGPVAAALVLAVTFACVYAAGRIFRVGILMQGKGAKFAQLVQWVFRG